MNNLHCICLFGLSLILFFLGGWLIPITDPTECCYTLTAKEMLASGDWLSPRIYGNFWFDKCFIGNFCLRIKFSASEILRQDFSPQFSQRAEFF